MLVCNVSMRYRRTVAADLEEVAAAVDAPGLGAIFASLVDDPANTGDIVDAFIGEVMLEPAAAADAVDAGAGYSIGILENIAAVDALDGGTGPQTIAAAVAETISAIDQTDAGLAVSYTTWNLSDLSSVTLSGGNLTATATAQGGVRAIKAETAGQYYWEYTIGATFVSGNSGVGLGTGSANLATVAPTGAAAAFLYKGGSMYINGIPQGSGIGSVLAPGNVIGVAADIANKLIWFRIAPSGNWNNSGTANPATGTGGWSLSALSGSFYPLLGLGQSGDVVTANFGATIFSGTVPSGFTSGWPA